MSAPQPGGVLIMIASPLVYYSFRDDGYSGVSPPITSSRANPASRTRGDASPSGDDGSDHHRRAAEPAERHRRGNGGGDAAHRLLANFELVARFLDCPDRRAVQAGGPGGPYPGACRRHAVGGEGAVGAVP